MNAVPDSIDPSPSFQDLALSDAVLRALADVGYESPSPIQAQTIPVLLAGKDMLGQAQTGTGKTAAFALPALTKIDLEKRDPQVLVLVPDARAGIAGVGGLPALRGAHEGISRAAHLRRPELSTSAQCACAAACMWWWARRDA